jgi:virginiamycin B lyase
MSGIALTKPHWFRWRHMWLPIAVICVAAIGALVWRPSLLWQPGLRPAAGIIEYPMLVKTDIPTAVDVAPDGAVWFSVEFSDAIGVFRNGKIERIRKGSQNFEPLGLASDGSGGAWYTDTSMRAISRVFADGRIQSFPLPTPIVRLGRLAVAPDGAVWFADIVTAGVTRLQDGIYRRHGVGEQGGTPYGIAVDAKGVVWTTLQGADKLGRLSTDGQMTVLDVPTRNGGLGDIAVDRNGAVWFLELRANKIARYADGRFTEFLVPTPAAGLTALATAPDGSVWFTELSAGKLGRLRNGGIKEFRLPHAGSRPFGVAVNAANDIWYTDLSGWLGMIPATSAKVP